MPRNVILAAFLPATPQRLFDMYLDAESHAAFTGAPASIEPQAGGRFSAFDGLLSGTILHVETPRLIVQTWRATDWAAEAIDTVLVLSFWPEEGGGRIELVHANVPEFDFSGVSHGWEKYYWKPWREYLESDSSQQQVST